MNTQQLINRFLEETNYINNDAIILIMAYGSRITNTNHPQSDLDLFMVSEHEKFISSLLIDGIKVDIHGYPVDEIKESILFLNATGNMYLKSVLKTGIVLKDRINLYTELCALLEYQGKRKKNFNTRSINLIQQNVTNFLFEDKPYRDIYYFFSLELIRKLLHEKNHCSNIATSKVCDIYQNPSYYEQNYFLKLPSLEFRENYLHALTETNRVFQKEILMNYLKELGSLNFSSGYKQIRLSVSEIKEKLIALHGQIMKCEEMLLFHHPYGISLFSILIQNMLYFAAQIECNSEIFTLFYSFSSWNSTAEDKIWFLETLFSILDKPYKIDYDDFYLKLNF